MPPPHEFYVSCTITCITHFVPLTAATLTLIAAAGKQSKNEQDGSENGKGNNFFHDDLSLG